MSELAGHPRAQMPGGLHACRREDVPRRAVHEGTPVGPAGSVDPHLPAAFTDVRTTAYAFAHEGVTVTRSGMRHNTRGPKALVLEQGRASH